MEWLGLQKKKSGPKDTLFVVELGRDQTLCCYFMHKDPLEWILWHFWPGELVWAGAEPGRMQTIKPCLSPFTFFHLRQERQRCSPNTGKEKEQDRLAWGSTKLWDECLEVLRLQCVVVPVRAQCGLTVQLCLTIPRTHSQPWLLHAQPVVVIPHSNVKANPKLLCWDREK